MKTYKFSKQELPALFIFFNLIFSSITCNNNPVIPPDDVPPGKRDYVWTIDSVDYGNLPSNIQLESIWGSSPIDVWGAGYTSDIRDCLWHYDGIKWARATEGTPITMGGSGSRNVGKVWGTAANDVWAFGDEIFSQPSFHGQAFIMHYDGSVWNDVTGSLTNLESGFFDVFGEGKNKFWLASYENVVYYNSGNWNVYPVGDSMIVTSIWGDQNGIFVLSYKISTGSDYAAIMHFSNNSFQTVDQTTFYNGKFGIASLWTIGNRIYTIWHELKSTEIISNGGINREGWKTEFNIPSPGYIDRSFYHTKKDIFAVGYPNLLYHYNGVDWKNINIILNNNNTMVGEYSAVWTNSNEIFVCDKDNGIIYHGR